MSKEELEAKYWDETLKAGKQPASVYAFCQHHGLPEAEFYQHFSSFYSIEGAYWKSLVTHTIATLENDQDAQGYSAQQKLLAFYYTFFEVVLKNRSRLLTRFPKGVSPGKNGCLNGFNDEFQKFATQLLAQAREEGAVNSCDGRLTELQEHGLYAQLRTLINFYRQDSSENFQDTDAFIEKSVKFAFDAARQPLFESGVDLLRFTLPRVLGKF
ncbi:MAG: hypothetical protein AAGC74_03885 [Verrucomicrobiota bacterium]